MIRNEQLSLLSLFAKSLAETKKKYSTKLIRKNVLVNLAFSYLHLSLYRTKDFLIISIKHEKASIFKEMYIKTSLGYT